MYSGHSWTHHEIQRDFTNSSDMETLPTPALFGDTDKDKTTVINNGNTGGAGGASPTTIGFHMETMVCGKTHTRIVH